MSDDNKIKLGEQLVRCVLDDKLSNDKKLRKMDYIIKMGGDINAESGLGFSVLSLAKMMQNDELVNFLEEKGAKETEFNSEKATNFFKTASIEEINKVLKILPDGYKLDCDVDLRGIDLTKLPDFSRVVINGDFYCHCNQLKTLEGAPREVGGTFDCRINQLISLEGAPSKVGGDFYCGRNRLTSLNGAPRMVGKRFNCFRNKLKTLEGAPSIVGWDFDCLNNPLENYNGKPDKIGGKFIAPSIEQVNIINGGNVR